MTQLIESRTPVARKPHRCEHCGQIITKGTKYLRQFCVDGGDAWTFVSHIDCHDAACFLATQDGHWYGDGIDPIVEYENNTGIFPDYIRGRFPHVICRLELRKQRRERRRA